MNGIDEKTKQTIIATIASIVPNAHIYLFGSYARGDYKEHDDIDIAIDAGKVLPSEFMEEIYRLFKDTSIAQEMDIVDLHNVDAAKKAKILREKVMWE